MDRARISQGAAAALVTIAIAVAAQADSRSDLFTVSVPVDATAANANAARDAARLDGEKTAYGVLLDRLILPADRAKLPAPTETTLNTVIQGFEVANERRSGVRYLATYTVHFRPDAIEQLLRERGVLFSEAQSKPVLVLPVLDGARPMLWDDPNPWRDAWSHAALPPAPVPLKVPIGEVEDVSAIDAAAAESGDDAHLRAIAGNYGNADILVSRAALHQSAAPESVDVSSTRFIPGSPGGEQSWVASYVANAGESEQSLLGRAVAGTAAKVEDAWKQANMIDYSQSGALTATVPAEDMASWMALRQRLGAVAALQGTEILALDRHGVRLTLHYRGSTDQLRAALAQNNLDLSGNDPDWVLQRRDAAAAPSPGQ